MATYNGVLYNVTENFPGSFRAPKEAVVTIRKGLLYTAYGELPALPTSSPGIASITVSSPTSIRVYFESAAVNNVALQNAGNYTITPALTVYSVTPGGGTNPTYVDLQIAEQETGQNYTLTLQRIVKA